MSKSSTQRHGKSLPKTNGVKRQSNGEVKPKPTVHTEKTLEDEIAALGGSKEDLEFLEDLESSSEVEGGQITAMNGSSKPGRSNDLGKGLSNILKEITLARGEEGLSETDGADSEESMEDDGLVVEQENERVHATGKPKSKPRTLSQAEVIFEARPDWYDAKPPISSSSTKAAKKTTGDSTSALHDFATTLLSKDNEAYRQHFEASSSHAFYNTVISSGTLSDKVSALTLAIQESPVHNIRALESLLGLAKKRSRSQAVDVLRALKDLFAQGSMLPGDRRLWTFTSNPGLTAFSDKSWKAGDKLPRGLEERHLIVFAFESWLKEQYFEIIKLLEIWSGDEIEFARSRALSYIYELLKEKPEQEANLLRLLINKLGDPTKKIASQASYLIMQLLATHPAMKMTVISALETEFLFKPGQTSHAKYYAVVTLNQTILSSSEDAVAQKLLDIYFGLFVGVLKPVDDAGPEIPKQMGRDERRRMKQKEKRLKSTPKDDGSQDIEMREKLTSAVLTGINRAYPFSDKTRSDLDTRVDTLFDITHSANFNTSIQALLLIQQLVSSQPNVADRFYRTLYESLLDPRLTTASNQKLYLNLLHRALKGDLNLKRVKAFVKRILQILSLHEPPFICGALFLLSDLQKTFPSLKSLMDQPEDHGQDEEHFQDVAEDEDVDSSTSLHTNAQTPSLTLPSTLSTYDPRKRDPIHSNADAACAWELLTFLPHFHPTVSLNAEHLLNSSPIPGKPDLSLHTLSHFLDRFVYRNPKLSNTGLKGSSLMQPMASGGSGVDSNNVLFAEAGGARRQLPVNSEQFLVKPEQGVRADEVFFQRYFSTLGKKAPKKDRDGGKSKRDENASVEGSESEGEAGDVVDSGDEEEVWKAMKDSAPDLEGDDGFDDDDELDDEELAELEDTSDDDDEDHDDDEDMNEEARDETQLASTAKANKRKRVDEADSDSDDGMPFDLDSDISSLDDNEDDADDQMDEDQDNDDDDFANFTEAAQTNDPPSASSLAAMLSSESNPRKKKKLLKSLPVFASADDYARMLGDDGEGEDTG